MTEHSFKQKKNQPEPLISPTVEAVEEGRDGLKQTPQWQRKSRK